MAPLIFLLSTFGILYLINRFLLGARLRLSFIGRASMAVMLIVTGISHFTNTQSMVEMMPDFLPAKREMIYFTGVCELAAVVGLLWDRTARLASVLLVIFFVLVLPANIAGSLKSVQFGGMEYGPLYLLFRVPLQIFFIWWVWYFGIRTRALHSSRPRSGRMHLAVGEAHGWRPTKWPLPRQRQMNHGRSNPDAVFHFLLDKVVLGAVAADAARLSC